MLPTNAAAAARAPPPAPASSVRPASGIPTFASGFGPAAPAAAGSGSYTTGTAYGGMGMARLPMGGTAGSDTVAGNTRKKARLG